MLLEPDDCGPDQCRAEEEQFLRAEAEAAEWRDRADLAETDADHYDAWIAEQYDLLGRENG